MVSKSINFFFYDVLDEIKAWATARATWATAQRLKLAKIGCREYLRARGGAHGPAVGKMAGQHLGNQYPDISDFFTYFSLFQLFFCYIVNIHLFFIPFHLLFWSSHEISEKATTLSVIYIYFHLFEIGVDNFQLFRYLSQKLKS